MPTLAEAFVDIIGRDTGLAKAMTKAQADVTSGTNKMQARLTQFANGMKTVGSKMSLAVTGPIVGALTLAVKAAAEAEDAQNKLQSALQATGSLAADSMQKFGAFASEIQKLTIYDDELILATMTYGHNLGIQADQLREATKAAAGLAAKYRIDLQTAMMLLGRAALGNTMMLKRYGIVLDENLSPQEKFNALLKIGVQNFGLAEAQAQTTSGQLMQLKNQIGDVAEEFGGALLPALRSAVEKLKETVDWVRRLSPQAKETIVSIAMLVAALGPLAVAIAEVTIAVKGLNVALTFLEANPMAVLITAIAALVVGLGIWVRTKKTATQEAIEGAEAEKKSAESLKDLATEYESLRGKADKTATEQQRMHDIFAQIRQLAPQYVEGGKLIEGAMDGIKRKAEEASAALRRAQIADAKVQLKSLQDAYRWSLDKENAQKALGARPGSPVLNARAKEQARIRKQIAEQVKIINDLEGYQPTESRDPSKRGSQGAYDPKRDAERAAKIRLETAKRSMTEVQRLITEANDAIQSEPSPVVRAAIKADYADRIKQARDTAMKEYEVGRDAAKKKAEADRAAWLELQKPTGKDKTGPSVEDRKSAWERALGLYEDAQVRMTAITQGETAARLKQIDIEASHRRKTIEEAISNEGRRAALLKALDLDVAAQKKAITDEQSKAEADAARAKIGFLGGGLSEVWRGAMTAGARLAVPEAPAVTESNRLSQAQLDELKTISGLLGRQIDEAKGSINKLSGAMAAT